MPELPDVEVFRRYLASTSLHQRIESVEVRNGKILHDSSAQKLRQTLKGRRLGSARRHGKHLFTSLEPEGWLMMHFGMTGSLKYLKDDGDEPVHTRLALCFENGYRLVFDDQRLLGRVGMRPGPDEFVEAEGLGPDALALDLSGFRELLSRTRGAIKSALMNQRLLAGLGNIYSDEILFQSGIHPQAKAAALEDAELETLFEKTRSVLEEAIQRGANPERLPETWLLRHREEGTRCPVCGGEVRKIKVSGRGGYYCPSCQSER